MYVIYEKCLYKKEPNLNDRQIPDKILGDFYG